MKKAILVCLLALSIVGIHTHSAQAEGCRVDTTTRSFSNGHNVGTVFCDAAGAQKVTITGATSAVSPATANAAAPTHVEAASVPLSVDLAGNQRVTLGTLFSGEDQTNNLLMISGGVVRQTQILGTGGVPSTATDATTTPQILPTGKKTFTGRVTCTGTCVQTQKVYGTWRSTADATKDDLIGTITLNASTSDQASFATDINYSYWYVVTTLTSGTTPLAGIFVQY